MGGAQLFARVHATALAAEPFAVEQARAGELDADPRALEPLDRLAVEGVGVFALAQQRPGACQDAERPIRTRGACPLFQPGQRGGGDLRLAATSRRLDELGQRRAGVPEVAVVAAALGGVDGRLVAAQAVVENGGRVAGQRHHSSLASRACVVEAGVDELSGLRFDAAPGGEEEPGVQKACVAGCKRNRVCLLDKNAVQRADQLIALAQQVQAATDAAAAASLINQMIPLAQQLMAGVDANGDGRITWEEGGLQQADDHIGLMLSAEPKPPM